MNYAARIAALPCPLCGSAKVEGDFGDESACYRCRDCGCQSGRVYFTTAEREADDFTSSEEFALAAWNRRAADAELTALRERVAELERDAARLDWLEQEMEREREAIRRHRPPPDSLFRRNMPITRASIDAALNKESA